jgi:hypothetical protein
MPTGRQPEFSKKEIEQALLLSRGNGSQAAELLNGNLSAAYYQEETGLRKFSMGKKGVKMPPLEHDVPLEKPVKADIINSIKRHRGILTKVAEELGYAGATSLLNWVRKDPEVRAAYEEARYAIVDKSEENVFDAIHGGDPRMSQFILKTLGKDRGYTERMEHDNRHEHVHSLDEASTDQLIDMLRSEMLAGGAIEAEFEVLEADLRELQE